MAVVSSIMPLLYIHDHSRFFFCCTKLLLFYMPSGAPTHRRLLAAPQAECVGLFVDPAAGPTPRAWSNQTPLNFDNVGSALLTLFVASTLDGYTPVMWAAMGVRWVGAALLRCCKSLHAAPALLLYKTILVFCGSMEDLRTSVASCHTAWSMTGKHRATPPPAGSTL